MSDFTCNKCRGVIEYRNKPGLNKYHICLNCGEINGIIIKERNDIKNYGMVDFLKEIFGITK